MVGGVNSYGEVNSSRETMVSSKISENLFWMRSSCEIRNYLKKLMRLAGYINHVIFINYIITGRGLEFKQVNDINRFVLERLSAKGQWRDKG